MVRVAEEVKHCCLGEPVALVASQGFDDGLSGETLVHEQGQRGNVERKPLCLARPVQKRTRHGLELIGESDASCRREGQTITEGRLESRVLHRGADLCELLTELSQNRLALFSR